MEHIFVLLVLFAAANGSVIPTNVYDPCSKSDPDLTNCLFEQLEKAKPLIFTGVPEINVPPLDPFVMNEFEVNQNMSELLWVRAKLKNLRITGISSVIFEKARVDVEKLEGEIYLNVPNVYAETEYDVQGQLLAVPMISRGFFKGNFTDLKIVARATAKLVKRSEVEYLQVDKTDIVVNFGDGVIKMISKNPELQFTADLIQNFFNQNPKQIFEAIAPVAIRTGTPFVKQIINNSLMMVPFSELLVD